MNPGRLHNRKVSAEDLGNMPVVSHIIAQKIINIAGLGRGDQVICQGNTGPAIEKAIEKNNANILTYASTTDKSDNPNKEPYRSSTYADALLWASTLTRQGLPDKPLMDVRQHLRLGGRLVMWATLSKYHDIPGVLKTIEGLLRRAGYNSIIVGHMPPELGDIVVATAILNTDLRRRPQ